MYAMLSLYSDCSLIIAPPPFPKRSHENMTIYELWTIGGYYSNLFIDFKQHKNIHVCKRVKRKSWNQEIDSKISILYYILQVNITDSSYLLVLTSFDAYIFWCVPVNLLISQINTSISKVSKMTFNFLCFFLILFWLFSISLVKVFLFSFFLFEHIISCKYLFT